MSGTISAIKSKASAGINKAATAVGIQRTATEDSNTLDELSEFCPKLTYQQRLIGFGACFVIGYLITFLSFNYFIDLIEGRPVPFVLIYSKYIDTRTVLLDWNILEFYNLSHLFRTLR